MDSRQLELRVAKALDAERKLSKNEFESLDRESKELQRLLGEYKREAEWAKGEMVGVRDELRQTKAQVERLSLEKVQMMEEHQGVLDQVRAAQDRETQEMRYKVQDLTQNLAHHEHQNTLLALSLQHFESRTRDLQTQVTLLEDDLAKTRL